MASNIRSSAVQQSAQGYSCISKKWFLLLEMRELMSVSLYADACDGSEPPAAVHERQHAGRPPCGRRQQALERPCTVHAEVPKNTPGDWTRD